MLSALPLHATDIGPDQLQWCELEPEHVGYHHSLGDVAFVEEECEEWWLRWDENGHRDLAALPGCPAKLGDRMDEELCTLPMEHAGAHIYEFR